MTIATIDPDAEPVAARSQDDYFAIAEKNLPGGGLGGYALPDDLRYIIRRGEGSRVQATDGRWFIDYIGGAGANIIGHSHPAVVEAITERTAEGLHFFAILNRDHTKVDLDRAFPRNHVDRSAAGDLPHIHGNAARVVGHVLQG